jgi:hypothetical protein
MELCKGNGTARHIIWYGKEFPDVSRNYPDDDSSY